MSEIKQEAVRMQRKRDRILHIILAGFNALRNRLGHLKKRDTRRQPTEHPASSPSRASQGPKAPAFAQAEGTGLPAWLELGQKLLDCGVRTSGALHADLIRSELALATLLELPDAVRSAQPPFLSNWKTLSDGIQTLWQDQNLRLLTQWQASFARIHESWRTIGPAEQQRPWPEALERCGQSVDKAWMAEWTLLQTLFDALGSDLGQQLEGLLRSSGLSFPPDRARTELEGTFRRAQGDLWGVWSTQAALLRDAARKVIEKKSGLTDAYSSTLVKVEAQLNAALEAIVEDVIRAWTKTISDLKQNLPNAQ